MCMLFRGDMLCTTYTLDLPTPARMPVKGEVVRVPRSRTCTTMVFIGVHLVILGDYNPQIPT